MRDSRGRTILVSLVLGVWVLPLVYVVWMSFAPGELLAPPVQEWSLRWYREFQASPRWRSAFATSLIVGGLSMSMSLVSGLGLAIAVTRYRFAGSRVLSGAVLLPLFVPTIVLGMGLLPLMMRTRMQGHVISLSAAHALLSLPVVFLLLRATLRGVPPDLELAARGLGASPVTAFLRVTLPILRPALFSAAVMAFILSLNEFTIALFLSAPRTRTLPAALWPEARDKETPLLAAASCVTILVTILGLSVSWWLLRRKV